MKLSNNSWSQKVVWVVALVVLNIAIAGGCSTLDQKKLESSTSGYRTAHAPKQNRENTDLPQNDKLLKTDVLCIGANNSATIEAWRQFSKNTRYRIASPSDFTIPQWTKNEQNGDDIIRRTEFPCDTGNINRDGGTNDFAVIIIDNSQSRANNFGLVVFNEKVDGKGMDGPYWVFQNVDLSKSLLGRNSGGLYIVEYNEDGTQSGCSIDWLKQQQKYICTRFKM